MYHCVFILDHIKWVTSYKEGSLKLTPVEATAMPFHMNYCYVVIIYLTYAQDMLMYSMYLMYVVPCM